jgi:hypothetical protein
MGCCSAKPPSSAPISRSVTFRVPDTPDAPDAHAHTRSVLQQHRRAQEHSSIPESQLLRLADGAAPAGGSASSVPSASLVGRVRPRSLRHATAVMSPPRSPAVALNPLHSPRAASIGSFVRHAAGTPPGTPSASATPAHDSLAISGDDDSPSIISPNRNTNNSPVRARRAGPRESPEPRPLAARTPGAVSVLEPETHAQWSSVLTMLGRNTPTNRALQELPPRGAVDSSPAASSSSAHAVQNYGGGRWSIDTLDDNLPDSASPIQSAERPEPAVRASPSGAFGTRGVSFVSAAGGSGEYELLQPPMPNFPTSRRVTWSDSTYSGSARSFNTPTTPSATEFGGKSINAPQTSDGAQEPRPPAVVASPTRDQARPPLVPRTRSTKSLGPPSSQ